MFVVGKPRRDREGDWSAGRDRLPACKRLKTGDNEVCKCQDQDEKGGEEKVREEKGEEDKGGRKEAKRDSERNLVPLKRSHLSARIQ